MNKNSIKYMSLFGVSFLGVSFLGVSFLGVSALIYKYINTDENNIHDKSRSINNSIDFQFHEKIKKELSDLKKEMHNLSLLVLPIRSVVMWYGEYDNIPDGWIICDGNNDTPKMLNRFVMGSNTSGDTKNKKLIASTSVEGNHKHDFVYKKIPFLTNVVGVGKTTKEGLRILNSNGTGSHSHCIESVEELYPDFVTMIYIMKIK